MNRQLLGALASPLEVPVPLGLPLGGSRELIGDVHGHSSTWALLLGPKVQGNKTLRAGSYNSRAEFPLSFMFPLF